MTWQPQMIEKDTSKGFALQGYKRGYKQGYKQGFRVTGFRYRRVTGLGFSLGFRVQGLGIEGLPD
jgi:hypothetical protein